MNASWERREVGERKKSGNRGQRCLRLQPGKGVYGEGNKWGWEVGDARLEVQVREAWHPSALPAHPHLPALQHYSTINSFPWL